VYVYLAFLLLAIPANPSRPDPNSHIAVGTGTAFIFKSTPLNVAMVVGLINSSAITSPVDTDRFVNAAAPPDPANKSNG
jgi:hypothetical protein